MLAKCNCRMYNWRQMRRLVVRWNGCMKKDMIASVTIVDGVRMVVKINAGVLGIVIVRFCLDFQYNAYSEYYFLCKWEVPEVF